MLLKSESPLKGNLRKKKKNCLPLSTPCPIQKLLKGNIQFFFCVTLKNQQSQVGTTFPQTTQNIHTFLHYFLILYFIFNFFSYFFHHETHSTISMFYSILLQPACDITEIKKYFILTTKEKVLC